MATKIEVSVERTGTGYSAYTTAPNLAVVAISETLTGLKANMVEGLNLHFNGERTFTEADLKIVLDLP